MTMAFEEYRSIDAVNFSTLKAFDHSPAKYLAELKRLLEPLDSEAIRVGSAAHVIALEPLEYTKRYVTYDGIRNKRHKAYQEFLAQHEGKTVLSKQEADRAHRIGLAVHSDPIAMAALDGEHEVTLRWTDERTGIKCKARLDAINGGVTDLKTARDIGARAFMSQAARMNYHVQLAWYEDAARANGYGITEPPRIVAVESSKPHCVGVFRLPSGVVDVGRQTYRAWLDRLVECRESDDWPGPYVDEIEFALPHWFGAEPETFFADLELAS